MAEDLLSLPDTQPLPSSLEPVTLPDRQTGLEGVFQDVKRRGVKPEQAAKVLDLSRRLGEPESFIEKNLPDVEDAVKAPNASFFRDLDREYPGATKFLSEPEMMASAHDDMENIRDHEAAVKEFGFWSSMGRSLNSGLARMNASIFRLPAAVYDAALIPYNLTLQMQGEDTRRFELRSPDWLINNFPARFYDAQAVAASTPDMETDILAAIERGQYSKAGRALASQVVANAPNQALLIGATVAGYGVPALVGAGALQAADVNAKSRESGARPGSAALNAVTQGTIESAFERLGTFGLIKSWEGTIAKSFGKKVSREVLKDLGKTLAHSMFGEANEEFWTQGAQDLSDYLTGVNPKALEGVGNRMVNAGIVGGASGGALTFGGTVFSGALKARANEVRSAERAKDFYMALGEKSQSSKLRERLPEQHQRLVQQLTENGPVESVYVRADALEKYFTSQKLDTATVLADLGAAESFMEAKDTGGLVKIPTAQMTRLIEDGHYAALADDVKFDPEGFSVNEAKERTDSIRQEIEQLQNGAKDALASDATAQAGYDLVFNDTKAKLAAVPRPEGISEQEWPQVIEDSAQIAASRVVAEAKKRGVPVEVYYQGMSRPDVVGGEAATAEAEGVVRGMAAARTPAVPTEPGLQGSPTPQATGESPLRQEENPRERLQRLQALFPTVSEPSPDSVTGHPDFVKMTEDAAAVVQKYAQERGAEANADFTRALFKELHDKLGEIRTAKTPEARMEAYKSVKAQYPDIEAEFSSLHSKWLADASPEFFESRFAGQYDKQVRPKAGIEAESLRRGPAWGEGVDTPLAQGEVEKPRGLYIPSKNLIALMKSADPSTFLHEAAHSWLRDTFTFIKSGQADAAYLADWGVMKEFLGVKDEQTRLTQIQQERFAQAFEVYLYESEAPSQSLRGIFARVRQWMTKVYGDVKERLGIEISPEVRAVFDRMLATEEEISHARMEAGYAPINIEGLDPQVAAKIDALERRARAVAEDAILKEQMSEITKAAKAALDEKRTAYAADAEKAIAGSPLYQAMTELRDRLAVSVPGAFGHDITAQVLAQRYLDGKLEQKLHSYFEAIAEVYGFADGKDFATKAAASKTLEQAVAESTKDYMAHLEQPSREAMREKARQALYSDEGKMLELLSMEQDALASMVNAAQKGVEITKRRRAELSLEVAAAKQYARETLGKKPLNEAQAFRPYITAERQAAVRAARATLAKDYQAAYKAKREQLLNHALASEAYRLRDQITADQRFLEKFQFRGQNLLEMPYGFVQQIDDLLSRFGMGAPRNDEKAVFLTIAQEMLAKGEESADIANATGFRVDENGKLAPETLPDLLQRVNQDYITVSIPDSIATGQGKLSNEITPQDLSDLRAAVQAVADIGKKFTRFLSAFLKGDIKDAAAELRAMVEAKVGTPYGDKLLIGSSESSPMKERLDALLSLPDAIIPDMVNLLTLVTYLDGGTDGPAHKYIYRPLKMAEDRKFSRYEKMTKEINGIFERHFTPTELAAYKERREYFGFIGRHMTHEEILSLALNWGNEGNRDRIRRGYKLDDVQVELILNSLNKTGWDLCQEVWDYLDTYWPEIVKLETLVSGTQPKRVQATPISTRYGAYRGGYYPIAYDFEKSEDAARTAEQKNALFKQYSSAAAHTDKGHTQSRVDSLKRPIRLSMDVLFNHLENVVHDLEYRAAVIDVSRLLRMHDAKGSITAAIGVQGLKSINETMKAVASDQGEFLSSVDKALRWFRFKATFATLAYRAFTLPLDATGNIINGVWEIGPKRMGSAMFDFVKDPGATIAFVNEKSERMRYRSQLRDRDIMDLLRKWAGKDSAFKQYGFMVQAMADEAVSYPLWADTYRQEIAKHGDEVKAVQIADETVTRTIGSGSVIDQVGAQRGAESKKIFGMYYTWLSMMFNRWWLDGKRAGVEWRGGDRMAAMMIFGKATLFAWGLQALNENLWRELFRNTPDGGDDDERNKRILARVMAQPFGYIWFVRDIAGFTIDKAVGKQANYRFSPLESAAEDVLKTAAKGGARAANQAGEVVGLDVPFGQNELDLKYLEDVARSGSFLAGVPIQMNNLVFNFIDWMEGNGELTWRDALQRRTKK